MKDRDRLSVLVYDRRSALEFVWFSRRTVREIKVFFFSSCDRFSFFIFWSIICTSQNVFVRSSLFFFFFSASWSISLTDWLTHRCSTPWFHHITFDSFSYESFFINLFAILASSSSSDEDLCGCPAPKRTRLTKRYSPSRNLSSSSKRICSMSTTADSTLLERLKSVTSHCNGNSTSFHPASTQTNHSLSNSQREVLRLIGQHLQSLGLR